MSSHRFTAEELPSIATGLLRAFWTSEPASVSIASSLVDAELRGHTSHGVVRLSTTYEPMVNDGAIDPKATPTVERPSASIASVDGNRAFGLPTGREAIDVGLEYARESGMSVVGVRNGAHLGRVGEWVERVADAGTIASRSSTPAERWRPWPPPEARIACSQRTRSRSAFRRSTNCCFPSCWT